jgi:uncharacterized membrane protein YbaN (DUF454 family)
MKRMWWAIGGITALVAGVIGIALPLLPTTPFILLAAFCFDRSSPRLHTWLINHGHFGPLIENWQQHGAVPVRVKYIGVGFMVAALVAGFYFGVANWVLIVQAVIFLTVSVFLISRPSPPN